jgi:hypothetical protein
VVHPQPADEEELMPPPPAPFSVRNDNYDIERPNPYDFGFPM